MNKKKLLSSFLFVIILLVGAYLVNAIQGDLSVQGVSITTPTNNTIINGTNYTFLVTLSGNNQTNMTNWTIQRGSATYVLGIDIGNLFNSTNITNNTQVWGIPDGIYNITVNASNGSGFEYGNFTTGWSIWNITFDTLSPYGLDAMAVYNSTVGIQGIDTNISNGTTLSNYGRLRFSYTPFDAAAIGIAFACNLTINNRVYNVSIPTNGTRITANVTLQHSTTPYMWNVTCRDQGGNINQSITQTRTFYINDTQAPYSLDVLSVPAYNATVGIQGTVTNISNGTASFPNYGRLRFSYTPFDSMVDDNFTCNLTINNMVYNTTNITNATRITANVTLQHSTTPYMWNVSCWDMAGNLNTSTTKTRTFYINDTQAPYSLDDLQAYNVTVGIRGSNSPISNGTTVTNNGRLQFNYTLFDSMVDDNFTCNITINNRVYNTSNLTNATVIHANITLQHKGNTPYLWNVSCWDMAGNLNTSTTQTRTFYINDTQAPYLMETAKSDNLYDTFIKGTGTTANTTFNFTRGNNTAINNNATIMFSYVAFDSMVDDNFTCNLTINGVVVNTTNTTNATRVYINVSLQYGWKYFNVTCWDMAGNTNGSSANLNNTYAFFQNDTVAPTGVGLTLSATSISKGASATLTCGASDVMDTDLTYTIHYKHKTISDEGYISSTGAYTFTPSEAGIYDIDCRAQDDASLSSAYTTAQTLTVNNPSSSGSSGGGSSGSSSTALPTIEVNIPAGETREVGNLDAAAGAAVAMSSGSTATFTVSGGSHSAVIKSITETSVVVTISSTPIDVELTIGETKEVDVDADTKNDLSVTLESIISGVANLKFTSLTITVPETTPTTPTTPTAPTTEAGTSLTWLWIVLVIIIIGAGVYFFMKKK